MRLQSDYISSIAETDYEEVTKLDSRSQYRHRAVSVQPILLADAVNVAPRPGKMPALTNCGFTPSASDLFIFGSDVEINGLIHGTLPVTVVVTTLDASVVPHAVELCAAASGRARTPVAPSRVHG